MVSGIMGFVSSTNTGSIAQMHVTMWGLIVLYVIKAALFFAGIDYLMKNKLNLE